MTTVADKVPFHELTGLLERISQKSGTDEKKKLMKKFIETWREFHSKIHEEEPETTDSFFPAMRLMLPQLDKDREAYGIKEHTLARLYIEILGLGKDSPAATKLMNFRSPKNAKADAGDFAQVAYFILKPRLPEKGSLTIANINNYLDEVANSNASRNKEGVRKNLLLMLKNTSAQEQKWLIRMIMKDLRMGISAASIFSVFHQDAEDLYNVKMSLEKVCTLLHDPKVRMHEIEVSLFSPFRPMLGDRGAPKKTEKLMAGKPYFIETKWDGERMQLHKKGDEYKYYSRSGNDYTQTYGSNPFDGNLTPHIANCFKEGVTACILDAEMVGFNAETKTIGTKADGFDIKSLKLEEYQPMLCVFDILLLNEEVLTNKTLRERKTILADVFHPVEGRIMLSDYKEGQTNADCTDALNDAIEQQEEGIMIKDPMSAYKPNTRKGGWYKIKPEYIGGLMDELDVLVVGGYFGMGHRAGMMSHFLCAVAVPPVGDDKPSVFHSFCRVGTGYTKKELYEFNKKLAPHWQKFNKKSQPTFLMLASGLKQKPDAWIEPSKSAILQIKAAEIIESDQFKTGCTLRFPRVEKIRDDKPWHQCLTTTEVEELRQRPGGKLVGQYAGNEDEDEPKRKKRKVPAKTVKPTLASQFRATDVSSVTKISEMLAGKEMCIMSGTSAHSKSTLEKKIVEYGGTFVQNPGDETFCVLVDKVGIKVKNIIAKGMYDVVKVDWLLRCIEQSHFIPWVPSDMIHTSERTARSFALDYDRHGDSFYEDTDIEKLKEVFSKIDEDGTSVHLSREDIVEVEMKYFPQDAEYGLFRLLKIYLDSYEVLGVRETQIKACSLELVGLELRYYGGVTVDQLDDDVSHVVINSSNLGRVRTLRDINKKRSKKFHMVTSDWVYDCIKEGKLLKERTYEPAASVN